jgi:hypothetical protein
LIILSILCEEYKLWSSSLWWPTAQSFLCAWLRYDASSPWSKKFN